MWEGIKGAKTAWTFLTIPFNYQGNALLDIKIDCQAVEDTNKIEAKSAESSPISHSSAMKMFDGRLSWLHNSYCVKTSDPVSWWIRNAPLHEKQINIKPRTIK